MAGSLPVHTNDLSTEEVVTGGDSTRDGESEVATVVVQHLCRPVVGVAGRETHLIDLEPALIRAHSRRRIGDLRHVDVDGTIVVSLQGESVRFRLADVGWMEAYPDSLVGARTVTGLLVHLDGDRIAS